MPSELDDELRAYVVGDIPTRVERLEKRVDDIGPRVEHAAKRAEEAVQIAQGVSFEWHDQRDALVRHVEQQGASIRDHLDSVTKAQNERIELALGQATRAGDLSERQLSMTKGLGKRFARMAREQRSSRTERRHELRKLSIKIPLYQALAVALIGAIVTVYAVRHGAAPQTTVIAAPTVSAQQPSAPQP